MYHANRRNGPPMFNGVPQPGYNSPPMGTGNNFSQSNPGANVMPPNHQNGAPNAAPTNAVPFYGNRTPGNYGQEQSSHRGHPQPNVNAGSAQYGQPGHSAPSHVPGANNTNGNPPQQGKQQNSNNSRPTPASQQNTGKTNGAAPPPHQQTRQGNGNSAPAQHPDAYSAKPDSATSGVNAQIARIDAKNKLVEFTDGLVVADEKDYGNIHGVGGSKHARNSTVGVKICDYTNGTGPNSVTVSCPVDVYEYAELQDAAIDAALGKLLPPWWNPNPKPGEPWYSFVREKNHGAYSTNNGMAPVKRVEIHYTPVMPDGKLSTYPWFISVSNFDAPVKERENGAIVHQSKKGQNQKSAFINASARDFRAALFRVMSFIRLWEDHFAGPVIASGSMKKREQDAARLESRKNGK